jgi:hypothetical protein
MKEKKKKKKKKEKKKKKKHSQPASYTPFLPQRGACHRIS